MNIFELAYPTKLDESHIKEIINLSHSNSSCKMGTAFMTVGEQTNFKSFPTHEISIIMEGKMKVFTEKEERILVKGDIVTLKENEMQSHQILEDCKVLWIFFGVNN